MVLCKDFLTKSDKKLAAFKLYAYLCPKLTPKVNGFALHLIFFEKNLWQILKLCQRWILKSSRLIVFKRKWTKFDSDEAIFVGYSRAMHKKINKIWIKFSHFLVKRISRDDFSIYKSVIYWLAMN